MLEKGSKVKFGLIAHTEDKWGFLREPEKLTGDKEIAEEMARNQAVIRQVNFYSIYLPIYSVVFCHKFSNICESFKSNMILLGDYNWNLFDTHLAQ